MSVVWGANEVKEQQRRGWYCYSCATWLFAGQGVVLRSARPGRQGGREVTHGLYCSRACRDRARAVSGQKLHEARNRESAAARAGVVEGTQQP